MKRLKSELEIYETVWALTDAKYSMRIKVGSFETVVPVENLKRRSVAVAFRGVADALDEIALQVGEPEKQAEAGWIGMVTSPPTGPAPIDVLQAYRDPDTGQRGERRIVNACFWGGEVVHGDPPCVVKCVTHWRIPPESTSQRRD